MTRVPCTCSLIFTGAQAGPFKVLDSIGIPTALKVAREILTHQTYDVGTAGTVIIGALEALHASGGAGFRGEGSFGFYAYAADKRHMHVSRQCEAYFGGLGRPATPCTAAEIEDVLLCALCAAAFDILSQSAW